MENSDNGSFTIHCPQCGGEDFKRPSDPQPDDQVTCIGCGRAWLFDDFQRMGREQFFEAGRKALGGLFGNGAD
ncbi:ECs_2282 family putative zinc-binding protein [Cupriavidus sp. Marseille-Q8015]